MREGVFSLWATLCLFLSFSSASATTLSDTLIKTFKTAEFEPKEVVAKITLSTDIPQSQTGNPQEAVIRAYKLQAKMASVFKKAGWQEDDQLQVDPLDAGLIELKIDEGMTLGGNNRTRFKAYLYQCDRPMKKYRGENLDGFFNKKVLDTAESCFIYKEKLQGKNYPY